MAQSTETGPYFVQKLNGPIKNEKQGSNLPNSPKMNGKKPCLFPGAAQWRRPTSVL
jgi:hypothetical protein